MAEEIDNLVLEHLRAMRAENASIRAGQEDLRREVQDGFARLSQRIDRMETQLHGLSYIVSTAVGAVLADTEDLKVRVGALEERTEKPI